MFWNGYIISSHTLLGIWLLIHTGIKLIHLSKRQPKCFGIYNYLMDGHIYQIYKCSTSIVSYCWLANSCMQLLIRHYSPERPWLTHWGRVTHTCVVTNTNIGSVNGLSPGRRQAIIWINAEILLIGPSATNISEILIEILTFSFKKMRLKVSSAKWRPFCLGLNVLMQSRSCMHM